MSLARRTQQYKLARQSADTAGLVQIEGAAPPMPEHGPAASEYQQLLAGPTRNPPMSLARRTQQYKLAQQAAVAAGQATTEGAAPPMPEDGLVASEYQQLLAKLHADLRELAQIQSQEQRTARKAEMIPTYKAWIFGALEVEEGITAPQDEIVVTLFLWLVDCREWDAALRLAAHICQHGLRMPARFNRGPGGFLISEMADAAINNPGAVSLFDLMSAQILLEAGGGTAWDMRDETRARFYRALAESWASKADDFDPGVPGDAAGGKPALIDAALTHYRRATQLDPRVGVKKQIEALEREAKKLALAAGAQTETDQLANGARGGGEADAGISTPAAEANPHPPVNTQNND